MKKKTLYSLFALFAITACKENTTYKNVNPPTRIISGNKTDVPQPKKERSSDTILLIDTTIEDVNFRMYYSLSEYQKQSPAPFKTILNIRGNSRITSDTIELQSSADTARLQPMMLVKGNRATNSTLFRKNNLILFQLAQNWGQPLQGLYAFDIEKNKIKLLYDKNDSHVSIMIENGFLINGDNLKVLGLECYHASAAYNAKLFTISIEKGVRFIKQIMIPEKEYDSDAIFQNANRQVTLSKKYLQ